MNQRQAERLLKVADTLEKVNPKNFNLETWVDQLDWHSCLNDTPEDIRKKLQQAIKDQHKCGTTACVAGYFPVIFPRSWKYNEHTPVLKNNTHWTVVDDAIEFFGITKAACDFLFFPENYPESHRSARYAAGRIRQVVNNKGDAPVRWKNKHGAYES